MPLPPLLSHLKQRLTHDPARLARSQVPPRARNANSPVLDRTVDLLSFSRRDETGRVGDSTIRANATASTPQAPALEVDLSRACFGSRASHGLVRGRYQATPSTATRLTAGDPDATPAVHHGFAIALADWPRSSSDVERIAKALVRCARLDGAVTAADADALADSLGRDLRAAIDVVSRYGSPGSIELSAHYQVAPGRINGYRRGAPAAVCSGVSVHRNGHCMATSMGTQLNANLRSYAAIRNETVDRFVAQSREGQDPRRALFQYFQAHATDPAILPLINASQPMSRLVRDFHDYSRWKMKLQTGGGIYIGLPNTFDLVHTHWPAPVSPADPLDQLMLSAASWRCSNDDAENTLRWLMIVSTYHDAFARRDARVTPGSSVGRSLDQILRDEAARSIQTAGWVPRAHAPIEDRGTVEATSVPGSSVLTGTESGRPRSIEQDPFDPVGSSSIWQHSTASSPPASPPSPGESVRSATSEPARWRADPPPVPPRGNLRMNSRAFLPGNARAASNAESKTRLPLLPQRSILKSRDAVDITTAQVQPTVPRRITGARALFARQLEATLGFDRTPVVRFNVEQGARSRMIPPIAESAANRGESLWDPLESTCRHASLSIL